MGEGICGCLNAIDWYASGKASERVLIKHFGFSTVHSMTRYILNSWSCLIFQVSVVPMTTKHSLSKLGLKKIPINRLKTESEERDF